MDGTTEPPIAPVRRIGITLAELADREGVTATYLRQQVRDGALAATKVGTVWLVSNKAADRWAAARKARQAGRDDPA